MSNAPASEPSLRAHEPLRQLLVPADFSKGSELALTRALRLPLAEDAVVHVVHVAQGGRPAKELQRAGVEARRELAALVTRVRTSVRPAATIKIVEELIFGEPFVELIRRSRDLDTELIVMGRHGRRPVRDMFIGSTAERVVRKGDVPVLVVKLKPSHPYRRPLLAAGLDDTTLRVLGLVFRVAPPTVTTFEAVHAFNVPFEGFVSPTSAAREKSEYRRSFQDAASVAMAKLVARPEAAGVKWKTTLRAGDPRSLILLEAARSRADLVALGTHGRSGVAHALVGSVAEWVISQAPCDVLVARPVRFSFELP